MSSGSSSSSSDADIPGTSTKTQARQRSRPKHQSSKADSDSDNDNEELNDTSLESGAEDAEDGAHDAVEEDVPALSHAEKRREKRKQQNRGVESQPDAAISKQRKVKNTAELLPSKVPQRQNSVWVGNLSFKTTPDSLRNFFDGVGEITRIHMPMKLASSGPGGKGAVKENRGFAYVDFATPDSKTVAITLSENHLEGRRLLIKDGGDFTGRPSAPAQPGGDGETTQTKTLGLSKTAQKILRSQKQPAGPTLFFGNLGFETTDQSILAMLNAHRKTAGDEDRSEDKPATKAKWIRKVRLGTFEDTGKCKGWAFVDFLTTDHATEALTNPKNYFLDGRKLVVEYGSPDAVRRGGAGPRDGKPQKEKGMREEKDGEATGPRRERVRPVRKRKDVNGGAEEDAGAEAERPTKRLREEKPDVSSRTDDRRARDSIRTRAKPGAALAMAKRETVSIVPSQGKKIVF